MCTSDGPCIQTDNFEVDPVPDAGFLLLVTNGDGRGTDEVASYEVFLNGERTIPTGHSQNAQAPANVMQHNTLKVMLTGKPRSKIFILIAYDARKTK